MKTALGNRGFWELTLLLPEGNVSFLSVWNVDVWSKLRCIILPKDNINILGVGDKVYEALLVVTVCEQ